MTELGPAPATVTEQDLSTKFASSIKKMIETELDQDVETERLTQVAIAIRNIMYWQSKQYVVPRYDSNNRTIEFVQAQDKAGKARFSAVYNIYEADGAKFIGAVGQRAPNVKALPDDNESEQDIAAANDVDGALRILRRKWDTDQRQGELTYNGWNTGPTFGLTTYVADGHKYGWTEEPKIELQQVDVGMGEMMPVPVPNGVERYPQGDIELTLASVLYVTIPYKAKVLADAPWLRYEYMEHKSLLKGLHGDKVKDEKTERYSGTTAEQESTIRAQHQESSPSGQTSTEWSKNRWHYARYWIRPSLYSMITGDVPSESGEAHKLSDALEEQFPDGLKIAFVNGRIVDVVHERMDDVWSVCKTGKGDRILGEPWGNNMIPVQDGINDFFNMANEIILRSIPKTLVDSSLIDVNKIDENDPEIAEIILTKIQPGQNIGNMMAAFPMARMHDQLMPFAQLMRAMSREIGGVTEALSGGGQPSQTYRGEKQRRDQSMMQFAPFFGETLRFWETAYTNAVKQWSKYGSGSVKAPSKQGQASLSIELASLATAGWHIEADEGIPMSYAEEVDRMLFLLNENNPAVIEQLQLLDPINSAQLYKMLGLQGFKSSTESSRQKSQKDIQKLLLEPPVPDIDPMTGQQVGELPSIPMDEFEDDPAIFSQLYREWCLVSQVDREKNPDGYANVRARGQQYQKKLDAMMAAQAMAGGEPPPPGGPPPGGPPPSGGPPPPMTPFDTSPVGQEPPPTET